MMSRNDEGAASTAPSTVKHQAPILRPKRYRRNAHKAHATANHAEFVALALAPDISGPDAIAGGGEAETGAAAAAGLGVGVGATPRDAWVAWLAPTFAGNESCYFTGTYSDDYGTENGLMAQRNVHKDFTRFLESWGYQGRYIVGVEQHRYRDILHLHAILEGPFSEAQRLWVKRYWSAQRGHARSLPVQDGCASYITKYALKGDTDSFEWRLS